MSLPSIRDTVTSRIRARQMADFRIVTPACRHGLELRSSACRYAIVTVSPFKTCGTAIHTATQPWVKVLPAPFLGGDGDPDSQLACAVPIKYPGTRYPGGTGVAAR